MLLSESPCFLGYHILTVLEEQRIFKKFIVILKCRPVIECMYVCFSLFFCFLILSTVWLKHISKDWTKHLEKQIALLEFPCLTCIQHVKLFFFFLNVKIISNLKRYKNRIEYFFPPEPLDSFSIRNRPTYSSQARKLFTWPDRTIKISKYTFIPFFHLTHSPCSYSNTNCFSNTLNSTGIKIQNQALHLLVMSLQFLSVWNVFSVFSWPS